MTTAEELATAFAQTSDAELLTMFARLTHKLHERTEDSETRAQRDLVEAEALRRMAS